MKISYAPPKEIVVFQCVKYPIDEFKKRFNMIRSTGQLIALNWAEGVVFLYIPVEEADVLEERMEGKLFISDIVYALMPKYEKTIGLDIPVVDATYDETLRELAKWLRKRSETKP